MALPLCQICLAPGATQFIERADGAGIKAYHILCLANQNVEEATRLNWTKPKAEGYLAGIIDGEGHVRRDSGRCEITNNDIGIIAATKTAAEFLDIPTSIRVTCQKKGYAPTFAVCFLGGRDTRKKLLKLPIVSETKRTNLAAHI
jgi:hypothetical protein